LRIVKICIKVTESDLKLIENGLLNVIFIKTVG